VVRLLHPEQHSAHGVPDPDGGEIRQWRQARHQCARDELSNNCSMGVVVDRTDQSGRDEEDVIDRRGATDAEMVERNDDEPAGGEVVSHAVVGVALDL
jgi:hypothetical protein